MSFRQSPLYERLSKLGTLEWKPNGLMLTFHKPLSNAQRWIFWSYSPAVTKVALMEEFVEWLDNIPDDSPGRKSLAERWREVNQNTNAVQQSQLYKLLSRVGKLELRHHTTGVTGYTWVLTCDEEQALAPHAETPAIALVKLAERVGSYHHAWYHRKWKQVLNQEVMEGVSDFRYVTETVVDDS